MLLADGLKYSALITLQYVTSLNVSICGRRDTFIHVLPLNEKALFPFNLVWVQYRLFYCPFFCSSKVRNLTLSLWSHCSFRLNYWGDNHKVKKLKVSAKIRADTYLLTIRTPLRWSQWIRGSWARSGSYFLAHL